MQKGASGDALMNLRIKQLWAESVAGALPVHAVLAALQRTVGAVYEAGMAEEQQQLQETRTAENFLLYQQQQQLCNE